VAYVCNYSYLKGWDWKDHRGQTGQIFCSDKITRVKWTGGVAVAQVVEHLLCTWSPEFKPQSHQIIIIIKYI
jgi:hypothetical protein